MYGKLTTDIKLKCLVSDNHAWYYMSEANVVR